MFLARANTVVVKPCQTSLGTWFASVSNSSTRGIRSLRAGPVAPCLFNVVPHSIFESRQRRRPRLVVGGGGGGRASSSSPRVETLSDVEFNQLLPLDQIKTTLALASRPRPAFLELDTDSVRQAARRGSNAPSLETDAEGLVRWSLKKLAWYGDRFWDTVVAEVLMVVDLGRGGSKDQWRPGDAAYRKGLLGSNEVAAKLATETGLARAYGVAESEREHLWEAYLAELYWRKGRRALLEFLVPLIKREYESWVEAEAAAVHSALGSNSKFNFSSVGSFETLDEARSTIVKELSQVHNSPTDTLVPTTVVSTPTSEAADRLDEMEDLHQIVECREMAQASKETSIAPVDTSHATSSVASRDKARLEILALPKIKPISFESLDAATVQFRSVLDERKIPYLFDLSPTGSSATLQLPGAPLIAAKAKKKSKGANKTLSTLTKLVKAAVKLGHFTIPNPKMRTNPSLKSFPLVFTDAVAARGGLFKQLNSRKVKFAIEGPTNGPRRTLTLPGFPPIVSQAATKAEHRTIFVRSAIELGALKLESAGNKPTRAAK